MTKKNYTLENIILFPVLAVGIYWWFFSGPSTSERAKPSVTQEQVDKECSLDIKCWASKWQAEAGIDCRGPIQRLAKNNFEWTDGLADPKLPKAQWLDAQGKNIRYFGSAIKFQNGFGAWIIHTYECDYDPVSRQVLAVRAYPGQL
ncbi:hypothetical protein J2X65_004118 [Ancylobacter sp. 3268]|uniref:hypothetical protein n=1 Tax=Ancylobacter sp. 3268 TaxID=2817752 RepID=UPI002855B7C7|nr:hypothetical protein [Ancylobacter sp. 3268]MDR6954742.1 hypothetical protein [Ancylobacter sp. 3268]